MRYYGFANFMLSSIQQGVQNFHVCHDMFVKYSTDQNTVEWKLLSDWASNHKTAIFLNGGNAAGIREVYEQLNQFGTSLSLPFQKFHEDEQSLDNTMTACGIVVPTYIVDLANTVRTTPTDMSSFCEQHDVAWLSPASIDLALFLNQFQLAR